MTAINQEHRDYGKIRKYPFKDDTTLVPDELFVDAVVYLQSLERDITVSLLSYDTSSGSALVTGLK